MSPRSTLRALLPLGAALAAAACGNGSDVTTPPGTVATVTVDPATVTLAVGATQTFTATAKDDGGNVLSGRTATWASGATNIATVDANSGLVTAVAAGTATITATVEGKSGSGTVTVTPAATTGLAQVSAGVDFSCGVTTEGTVLCWGDNSFGTLGNGTTGNSAVAKAIGGGFTATSVSAGTGILGHACAVATTGAGYCWGSNLFGELGNGTSGGQSTTPVVVSGVTAFGAFGSGFGSTCAAGTDGTGYCWGGLAGGLGDGADTASGKTPVAILGGKVYKDVRAGYNFACGLTTDGRLFCWGLNNGGALGNGTQNGSPTPAQVAGHTFTAFDTGDGDVCGVATDGTFCWGINSAGEVGNGTTAIQTTPAAVAGGIAFTSVSVGASHSCGVTAAGAAYCWGAGDAGQLGNNATLPSTTPVAVAGGHVFAAVSAGTRHSCGVTTTNEGWCWGAGTSGQLGNNGTQGSSVPVRVQLP